MLHLREHAPSFDEVVIDAARDDLVPQEHHVLQDVSVKLLVFRLWAVEEKEWGRSFMMETLNAP